MPLSDKKKKYAAKLMELLDTSKSVFIISVDNVGSRQMQDIRMALRGKATVLMGKNTTIRKVFADYLAAHPNSPVAKLLPHVRLNVGFVFTSTDINEVRDAIIASRVPAPARPGSVAPIDVWVEPGPTGCDPGQTGYFQTMNVPTKIVRGQIEITSRVQMCHKDEKVSFTAGALLDKLGIKPFSFGVVVKLVYTDGVTFDPAVLDLSDDDLVMKFQTGVRAVAALSMAIGYPTLASLPHSITNAFKNMLAITLESDYSFQQAEDYMNAATAAAAAPVAVAADAGAAAADAGGDDSSSSSAGSGAANLFGGSDSDSDSDSSS